MNDPNKIQEFLKNHKTFYVSITGLELKKPWHFFSFAFHAFRSINQAKNAEGNLYVNARRIEGVHHTLSAWTSREKMQSFIYQGHHKEAIKAFRRIATGKTFGYEAKFLPTWDELKKLYEAKAKDY